MAATTVVEDKKPKTLTPGEVPIRLSLPIPVYERYQALAGDRDIEEFLTEHLRQSISHGHTGSEICFSGEQANKLCKITGRGITTDAALVLERLKSLCEVIVGDVIVELDAQVMDRLKHIPRAITVEKFIHKNALNGIRTSLGLSPK